MAAPASTAALTALLLAPAEERWIGPFRLVRQLGRGGFAPVWLAEEIYDGRKLRDAAVKLFSLPDGIAPGSAAAARWRDSILDEARALCRVEHPGVVRFYALHRDDARGVVGLVMEHVAGVSLDVALDERGQNLASRDFAKRITALGNQGYSELTFIIGGADGLAPAIRDRAGLLLSFGAMTWPHMLVRVLLMEQIYRAQTIIAGHPYHRD